jgi:anti-sigma regulatory factor (Ser/Thr protein kinase)
MKKDLDLHFTLPAAPDELANVRQIVRGIAEALDVTPERVTDVIIAVDEACANVVAHAYRPEAPGAMNVRAHTDVDDLVVVVSDQGSAIVDSKQPGAGVGLRLIRELSDELVIEGPGPQGTRLTMRFAIDPQASSPS